MEAWEGAELSVADGGVSEGGRGGGRKDAGLRESCEERSDGEQCDCGAGVAQECFHDAGVLFGLERAGGVKQTASGGEMVEGATEDCDLASGLPGEVCG